MIVNIAGVYKLIDVEINKKIRHHFGDIYIHAHHKPLILEQNVQRNEQKQRKKGSARQI